MKRYGNCFITRRCVICNVEFECRKKTKRVTCGDVKCQRTRQVDMHKDKRRRDRNEKKQATK